MFCPGSSHLLSVNLAKHSSCNLRNTDSVCILESLIGTKKSNHFGGCWQENYHLECHTHSCTLHTFVFLSAPTSSTVLSLPWFFFALSPAIQVIFFNKGLSRNRQCYCNVAHSCLILICLSFPRSNDSASWQTDKHTSILKCNHDNQIPIIISHNL